MLRISKLSFGVFILIIYLASSVCEASESSYIREYINVVGVVVPNKDCHNNNTCDLVHAWYWTGDYVDRFSKDPPQLGSLLVAGYRTTSVESLEQYIFVQFIRGCMYESFKTNVGIETRLVFASHHFSLPRAVTIDYADWTVDSYDTDPAYSTDSQFGLRHYLYRWNETPFSFNPLTDYSFGQRHPKNPELYVMDNPSTGLVFSDGAVRNVSLEFQMCLYKSSDVPKVLDDIDIKSPKPLSCFDWNSSYIYNHSENRFESSSKISKVCKAGKS